MSDLFARSPVSAAPVGPRVSLHVNLHKGCPSLTAREGAKKGRVIGNPDACLIRNVTFKVSAARREAVVRSKVREVHAWAYGECPSTDIVEIEAAIRDGVRVHYNPYRAGTFTTALGEPVAHARLFVLKGTQAWAVL